MLDAAKTVRGFPLGVSMNQYMQDRKLQLAVERDGRILRPHFRGVAEERGPQSLLSKASPCSPAF